MNRIYLCLAIAAFLLVACSSNPPTVGIVGDSITHLSAPDIKEALRGVDYTIAAQNGKTIADMTPVLQSQIIDPGPPRALFVNLGTNDVMRHNSHWRVDWDSLMADAAKVQCLVLFTINDYIGTKGISPTPQDVNSVIFAAQRADPHRVHIIDWNAAVRANVDKIVDETNHHEPLTPTIYAYDGVHPNNAGQKWIAQHIASALISDCHE